jgi:hypothetical protein
MTTQGQGLVWLSNAAIDGLDKQYPPPRGAQPLRPEHMAALLKRAMLISAPQSEMIREQRGREEDDYLLLPDLSGIVITMPAPPGLEESPFQRTAVKFHALRQRQKDKAKAEGLYDAEKHDAYLVFLESLYQS